MGRGRGEIPSKSARESVSSALASCSSKNLRASALRVLSAGQVERKRIWEADPSWKVLYFFAKKHGLAISNLWTCSKVFVVLLALLLQRGMDIMDLHKRNVTLVFHNYMFSMNGVCVDFI